MFESFSVSKEKKLLYFRKQIIEKCLFFPIEKD